MSFVTGRKKGYRLHKRCMTNVKQQECPLTPKQTSPAEFTTRAYGKPSITKFRMRLTSLKSTWSLHKLAWEFREVDFKFLKSTSKLGNSVKSTSSFSHRLGALLTSHDVIRYRPEERVPVTQKVYDKR